MKPSVDAVMSCNPCEDWPRSRVESLFAKYGPFDSWAHMLYVCRHAHWPVPGRDIDWLLRSAANRVAPRMTSEVVQRYKTTGTWSDFLASLCCTLDDHEA